MSHTLPRHYAAIFFFAPFVHHRLRGHNFGLSTREIASIQKSVRRGYVTLVLGVCFVIASVILMGWSGTWTTWLYRGMMGATLLSLVVGVWRIHRSCDDSSSPSTLTVTTQMLLSFVPGYNRYMRYTHQNHTKPYRWLKESLLWRYVITLLLLIPVLNRGAGLALILLILRVITLAAGYDIIPDHLKQGLNRCFTHHVDEIWSYAHAASDSLISKTPYGALLATYRNIYRRTLSRTPQKREKSSRISYILYICLILGLIRGGIISMGSGINIPLVVWGVLLLCSYTSIRRYYHAPGPAPLIQPIIEHAGIAHQTKQTTD